MGPLLFVDIYEIVLSPEVEKVNFEKFMAEELNIGHGNHLYRSEEKYVWVLEWVGRPNPFHQPFQLENTLKSFSARVSGSRFQVVHSERPSSEL